MRAVAVASALAALGACGLGSREGDAPRPSFVVIVLDDARFDGLDRMPVVQRAILPRAVVFQNAFIPVAICAPSRASLLTGADALRHGTRNVTGPDGGARVFREGGWDRETVAVWLQRAGYRTGLFGKYLNAYWPETEAGLGPGGGLYVPPGWDRWWAFVSPEGYGGRHGETYRVAREDGSITRLADHASDREYSTDRSARELREFAAAAAAEGRPFLAWWAPYAPHIERRDPVPAARHRGAMADLPPFRPPNWDEPDVSDKPYWVRAVQLGEELVRDADEDRRRNYETLLAVDEQIGALLEHLAGLGVAGETLLLITSDNGVAWGAHGLPGQLKGCPYEECQRVPMLVLDPRAPAGRAGPVPAPVLNVDVAPTLAELAGVSPPGSVDGASFAGFWRGPPPEPWRSDYLMAHWRRLRSTGLQARGPVSDGDRFALLHGPPGVRPRPRIVFEFDDGDGASPDAVPVPVQATPEKSLAHLGRLAERRIPHLASMLWRGRPHVVLIDRSPLRDGVYGQVLADRGGVLSAAAPIPDYFGVRDVAGGLSWVEYETGEVELYDLRSDPFQLENRAADPAFAAQRQRLAARLGELLGAFSGR